MGIVCKLVRVLVLLTQLMRGALKLGAGGASAVENRVPNPGHGANPFGQALGGRGLCRWTSS